MDMAVDVDVIKQHLIDPEICIRCNTCEATCPVDAITHDDRNYVVRADVCNGCMACISPCPTGSIDNWRTMPAGARLLDRGAADLGRAAGRTDARAARGRGRRRRRSRRRCRRRRPRRRSRRPSRARRPSTRPSTAPPCRPGRPRTPTPTCYPPKTPDHRHRGRQLQLHRGRLRERDPPHRARLRRHAVPGARGPVDRHHPARHRRQRQAASSRASTRSPARATASGPATTTSR